MISICDLSLTICACEFSLNFSSKTNLLMFRLEWRGNRIYLVLWNSKKTILPNNESFGKWVSHHLPLKINVCIVECSSTVRNAIHRENSFTKSIEIIQFHLIILWLEINFSQRMLPDILWVNWFTFNSFSRNWSGFSVFCFNLRSSVVLVFFF